MKKVSALTCSFSAVIIMFSTYPVRSQGGPPMITDDTETVPKCHWEINAAFTLARGFDAQLFATPLLDINYGLSHNTQSKVEIPWLVLHRNGQRGVQGLGNTNIGIRWRFRDENKKHRVAISIYPQFEFNNPTPSVRRGVVDKGPEFLMPMQWQTKVGKYAIGGDVGYRFKRGFDEVSSGFIIGKQITPLIELMAELYGAGQRQQLGKSEIAFNLGSRVKLKDHLTLLLSGGRSIRPGYDPRFIGYAGIRVDF